MQLHDERADRDAAAEENLELAAPGEELEDPCQRELAQEIHGLKPVALRFERCAQMFSKYSHTTRGRDCVPHPTRLPCTRLDRQYGRIILLDYGS